VSIIHSTYLRPTKLELLTDWLPRQTWYRGSGVPELAKAGGFRLDDPDGTVGIEFLIVTDAADRTGYLIALSYRPAPLPGGEPLLVGTAEHGVLGPRWIYDGTGDPVVRTQLAELGCGRVEAQHQSRSDTVDRSVLVRPADLAPADAEVALRRVLQPDPAADTAARPGQVIAGWTLPDGTPLRGVVATVARRIS
jgi:Maltokinase N-terminal cap domain